MFMKRNIIIIICMIVVFVAGFLIGTFAIPKNEGEAPALKMKLSIKQSSWSGDSPNYEPEEIEKEYDIKLNEKYIIKTRKTSHQKDGEWVEEEEEVLSFVITEVNDSNIKINTYQVFSDNDDGTVDLQSDKREFIVTTEKALRLTTPTMDYGDIFIFKLIK